MTDLKTKILHIVSKENIKMTPRWKFALYSGLGIVGIFFAFLVTVFAGSLILFVLSKYGFLDMPFFDFVGTLHALNVLPVILLFVTVILLVLIETISLNYTFSFRRPLSMTLLLITSMAVATSFAISKTGVHESIRDYARSHHFDMMSKAYDRPHDFKKEGDMTVVRGVVVVVSTTTATIKLFNGETLQVEGKEKGERFVAPPVGSDIVVFGKFHSGVFEAVRLKVRESSFWEEKENLFPFHLHEKQKAHSNDNFDKDDYQRGMK